MILASGLMAGAHAQTNKTQRTGKNTMQQNNTRIQNRPLAPNQKVENGVIVTDSIREKDPAGRISPSEQVPENPAPGFENVNDSTPRLPKTDKLDEPR